ncbi:MAG: hypothetical protein HY244_14400 [Rhizobiales bacterium]|nr:hypothetical protein [Hyphomicrobiales bacterium]
MRAKPFKWLLVGLMVLSFAGRPWAQSLPASSEAGCGGSRTVTMQAVDSAAAHEIGASMADEAVMPQHDSGKAKSADCAKSCAAVQVMALAAMTWSPEVWPQSHSTTIEVALIGHPPKPELSPPIASI